MTEAELRKLEADADRLFEQTVERVLVIIETARCSKHTTNTQKAYLGQATRSIVDAIDESQAILEEIGRWDGSE